ncbi:hypothetical protein C5167_009886 [Papaver somniferum]|uniref:Uncharacterized protein n=1 Tax=Papaver somniferum TaxID=3469 RepID=A0A4Y7JYM3_PAPSO|nr:hypothetical protein C5167_009886 [Papaver somniferum]
MSSNRSNENLGSSSTFAASLAIDKIENQNLTLDLLKTYLMFLMNSILSTILYHQLVLIHPHLHNHLSQTVQGASKRKLMVCCVRRWYEIVCGLSSSGRVSGNRKCRKARVLDSTSELQLGGAHRKLRKETGCRIRVYGLILSSWRQLRVSFLFINWRRG